MPDQPDQPDQRNGGFSWTQFSGAPPGLELVGTLRGLAVVDVGCGAGRTAAVFARHGAHVTGVDIDAAHIGRRGVGVSFVVADAAQFLTAHPKMFDLVVSKFGALDFSPAEPLLMAARAALRPGGRLVASSRHPDWDRTCGQLGLGDSQTSAPGPQGGGRRNLFSPASWRAWLWATGYRSTRTDEVRLPRTVLADYLATIPMSGAELEDTLADVPACTVMVAAPW